MNRSCIWTGLAVAVLAVPAPAQPPASLPAPGTPLAPPPPRPVPIAAPEGLPPAAPPVGTPAVVTEVDGIKAKDDLQPSIKGCKEYTEEPGAFLLGADYLLLKPRRRPTDYAIVGPGGSWGPQGNIVSVNWDYDSAFRVMLGYRFPGEGWDVRLGYTYLQSDATGSVSAPAGQVLLATLTHPSAVVFANQAAGTIRLTYNLWDLELGRTFHPTECLAVRAFAGPRIAQIDQKFNAFYDGLDANHDAVLSTLNFDGAGIRFGADANVNLGHGLGAYGRGGLSMLAGHFRSTLGETTNAGATTIVNVTDRFDKVVPVLEMGLGLSWQYHNWRLTAGYEFTNWFGMSDGIGFSDDAHPGKYVRRTGDLSLDGLVLRAEWEY
jgi:hypothetical protein